MSTKHTPLPWFVSGVRFKMNGNDWHAINRYNETLRRDDNIACVGFDPRTGDGLADAHLIVRAVNSHDAMVKALETAVDRLEMVAERRMPNSNAFIPAVDAALEQCRAALSALNTSGADQPGTAAIVPNQQDDGSKG